MATIRERQRGGKPSYHVQVRMAGFPARTETFTTRRNAERWAKTVEAEMIDGRHYRSVEARRRTLGEAIDRYLESELPKKRDDRKPRARLLWWKDQLGKSKLAEIAPATIVECRDRLARTQYQRARPDAKRSRVDHSDVVLFNRTPATINRYLANLSHVFTVARREWHWLSHNPMDGVSKLRESKGRVRALSDDERKVLLAHTAKDATLHTFVVIALSTACRAGELRKLEWSDVDLKAGRLLFRETKNAQPRTAWLSGGALDLLKAHGKVRRIDGTRVFESVSGGLYDYAKPFRAAVAAAGISGLRFHDLRHTAATYLAQQGATEQQLRAIGGWKSGIVSRYVHLAGEDAKAALEKLAEKISK